MLQGVASANNRIRTVCQPLRLPGPATRCRSVLLAVAALAGCGRVPDASQSVLTSAAQVRQLSATQIRFGVRVRIQGILTYFDGNSSYCFVQDSTGGIRVSLASGQTPPAVGWRVEATGTASAGGAAPAIMEARITALRADALPPPVAVLPDHVRDPVYEYRLVTLSGVVRSFSAERPGLAALELRAGNVTVWATVPASITVVNESWVDADIRASGVLAEPIDENQNQAGSTLFIPGPEAIETRHPATPAAALPVAPIRSLLALDPARLPAHRVRVRGVRYTTLQGGLAVLDQEGQIAVRLQSAAMDPQSRLLDAAGFVAWEAGRPVLDRADLVTPWEAGAPERGPAPGTALTTAKEVHQLTPRAARRAYPVRLRAVVTYFDPFNHLLFVQDRSDGIFVALSDKEKILMRAGDEVEVTGVTTADFAPDVAKAYVKILGHSQLPAPAAGSFASASWGREDCRWLELKGTVQRVTRGSGDTLLTLAWGQTIYKAHVLASPESLAHLVDAEVKLQGVCGALFNGKRQMLGIQMFVPGAECIRVLQAAAPDPFAIAPAPIAAILQFSLGRSMGHRVRVQGAVTYPNRSGATWIRDATGGVMIQDHDAQGLVAGDVVDVVGFPVIAGFSSVLRGAQVKRVRSGAPPLPVRITARDAMTGDYDGQLVEMEGKLMDRLQQPAEELLALSSGEIAFTAHLAGGAAVQSLEPGARLRLTGICAVEVQQAHDLILPQTFRLMLRSPADIVIVGRPPWLRADRVIPVLSGAALVVAAALAWVGLLRRRVRSQTLALRAQTVQIQAAHQRTREALQKACEAETLDLDSKQILELIARDEAVDLIVERIAEAVALHCDGALCAILLGPPYARVCAVPALPAAWLHMLNRIDFNSVSLSAELRDPREFSNDPAWAQFIDSHQQTHFQKFCSAPILVEGATAGVIAGLFRYKNRSADGHEARLDFWCNIAALALERRRLHDQLSYRAQHDALTGLPNRLLLYERLEAEIERATRRGGLLGVLYLDLDGFKQINDTYGHDAGDLVLTEVARRMTSQVRRGDTVARIGGDEFVVVLPMLSRREDAEQIAEKIAAALVEPMYSNPQRLSVSACVGIAVWPLDGNRPDPLLRFADGQMYNKKRRRWYDAAGEPAHPAPPSGGNREIVSRPN